MSRFKPTYGSQWKRESVADRSEWEQRNPILPIGFSIKSSGNGWFSIHCTSPDIPRLDLGVPTYLPLDQLRDLRKCIDDFLNKEQVEEKAE